MIIAVGALLAATQLQAWHLSPHGLGPVRIGMSQAQVSRSLRAKLSGEAIVSENECVEKTAGSFPGLTFLFERGRLGRISVSKPSRITTARGMGVGAVSSQVRRAYGRALKVEPNFYEELPAQYLTYWAVPKKRGIRFETSSNGRVYVIHAGDQSINYVEGCA
ncbi:MAG: hypothetical protein ABIQ32_00110 [Sphingomicrobium sp.]